MWSASMCPLLTAMLPRSPSIHSCIQPHLSAACTLTFQRHTSSTRQAHDARKERAANEVIQAARPFNAKAGEGDRDEGPRHQRRRDKQARRGSCARPDRKEHVHDKNKAERNSRSGSAGSCSTRSSLSQEDSDGDMMIANSGHHDAPLVDVKRKATGSLRHYAEEELDRYNEASGSRVGLLALKGLSLKSIDASGVGGAAASSPQSARRTPRLVPYRPSTAGRGGLRKVLVGAGARDKDERSPRTVRGQLVTGEILSAR